MTAPDLEPLLLAAYREEAALYAQAVALAGQAVPATDAAEPPWLPAVLDLLARIDKIEQRIAEAKVQWQRHARTPGNALQETLAEVARQVETLGTLIGAATRAVEARRAALAPQLEGLARFSQGQQAYVRAQRRPPAR